MSETKVGFLYSGGPSFFLEGYGGSNRWFHFFTGLQCILEKFMGQRRFPWPTLSSATVTVALSTRVQRATFSRIMKNELKWLPKFWHIKYMGRYYSLTKIIPTRQQYEQIDVTLIGTVSFCTLGNVRWNWGDSTNTGGKEYSGSIWVLRSEQRSNSCSNCANHCERVL